MCTRMPTECIQSSELASASAFSRSSREPHDASESDEPGTIEPRVAPPPPPRETFETRLVGPSSYARSGDDRCSICSSGPPPVPASSGMLVSTSHELKNQSCCTQSILRMAWRQELSLRDTQTQKQKLRVEGLELKAVGRERQQSVGNAGQVRRNNTTKSSVYCKCSTAQRRAQTKHKETENGMEWIGME